MFPPFGWYTCNLCGIFKTNEWLNWFAGLDLTGAGAYIGLNQYEGDVDDWRWLDGSIRSVDTYFFRHLPIPTLLTECSEN